ncbi:MAG: hypothetical protein A2808_02500 [Candidatus Moranbacteria bacterium RIFCSPHIGHO2_01_FULL_55_24]|nr:MAG: hypothetical protein A2808_02500 [Candidatus Moranbacteria bacterium RIFCSPHIGHO2_01_FULL_55_24]
MGLFFPSKRIMPRDFKNDVRNKLYSRGLTHNEIDRLSETADAALNEPGVHHGIDRREKDQLVRALREHRGANHLSDRDIQIIDKTLDEEL